MQKNLQFLLNLAKAQSILNRRFDRGLNGLGLSEFMILSILSASEDGKMRRVELAEQMGLTQSGITRLLAPMEKIGLIKRKTTEDDARVSFVVLASGGKSKLEDGLDRAKVLADDLLPSPNLKKLEEFSELLDGILRRLV